MPPSLLPDPVNAGLALPLCPSSELFAATHLSTNASLLLAEPRLILLPLFSVQVNEAMDYVGAGKARYRVVLLSEGYTPEPCPLRRLHATYN